MKRSISQLSQAIAEKITNDNVKQLSREIWWTLIKQKRYGQLSQLMDQVEQRLAKKNNKTRAVLTCALEPSKENIAAIKQKLKTKFGKEVELETIIDKSLLGGFKVSIDDFTIDLSYRTKLNQLKLKLAGANE